MTIEWFGKTCVRIVTGEATVVIDPFSAATGLKPPRLTADVLLQTDPDLDVAGVAGEPFVIDGPGEYEVKKVFVYGVATVGEKSERQTLYQIEAEGISCAHLGRLGHQLSNGDLERFEGVDVLFVPVGGHGVLNSDKASEVISAIEPRIVIPMEYKVPGLKETLDSVSAFAKEFGVKESDAQPKFRLAKKDLPQDNMQVVILNS